MCVPIGTTLKIIVAPDIAWILMLHNAKIDHATFKHLSSLNKNHIKLCHQTPCQAQYLRGALKKMASFIHSWFLDCCKFFILFFGSLFKDWALKSPVLPIFDTHWRKSCELKPYTQFGWLNEVIPYTQFFWLSGYTQELGLEGQTRAQR